MRRRAVQTAAIAVFVASILAVGVGFAGTAAIQDDGGEVFVDEDGEVVSNDRPTGGDVSIGEPGLISLRTLGAVGVAIAVALLVVAAVRRADR
ncbi:hypothetical protein ABNG02_06755 [Halorubrum ejinorense]|uniref:Uncharacterized protein n=1 Tax=Halorubrum ejinorense TaxID=425309 RepID=A0AAV3SV62_9EURY